MRRTLAKQQSVVSPVKRDETWDRGIHDDHDHHDDDDDDDDDDDELIDSFHFFKAMELLY